MTAHLLLPLPGRIQLSSATHELLMGTDMCVPEEWQATGGIEVKGKGMMDTYLWNEEAATVAVGETLVVPMLEIEEDVARTSRTGVRRPALLMQTLLGQLSSNLDVERGCGGGSDVPGWLSTGLVRLRRTSSPSSSKTLVGLRTPVLANNLIATTASRLSFSLEGGDVPPGPRYASALGDLIQVNNTWLRKCLNEVGVAAKEVVGTPLVGEARQLQPVNGGGGGGGGMPAAGADVEKTIRTEEWAADPKDIPTLASRNKVVR